MQAPKYGIIIFNKTNKKNHMSEKIMIKNGLEQMRKPKTKVFKMGHIKTIEALDNYNIKCSTSFV